MKVRKKQVFFIAIFLSVGVCFMLTPIFFVRAQSSAKLFQGHSKKIRVGTAVVFLDGEEFTRVPLLDGFFQTSLILDHKSHLIQVVIFDDADNPVYRKVLDSSFLNEGNSINITMLTSIAATLANYDAKVVRKLEKEGSQEFHSLVGYIKMMCEAIQNMQLQSGLSYLELIDRLIEGEQFLAILQSRLGGEMGSQVLVELKKSNFPRDGEGNLDFIPLNNLIKYLRISPN